MTANLEVGMELPGPRPQPLGVLPWPAGLLVLPDVPQAQEVATQILAGGVPQMWPDALRFYEAALAADPAVAAELVTGDDLVARYNRAVLVGGEGVWEELAASCDGELGALVALARYSIGQIDEPPVADGLGAEVAALVLSARASAALEHQDPAAAAAELRAAVAAASSASPVLASSLRLTLAQILADSGEPAAAAREADAALQLLPLTADRELRAHLQMTRALARQQLAGEDRGALLAVVGDLTEATKVFREETHPELFALCNQHLALAYLVMPMSDQGDRLRLGVAVNALRAALRVYTPQTHPAQWATTQVNLANALQYLPSVHQEQNLDEAVQIYEEVLQYRDPQTDPIGYARILSNQGNALGHLGVFDDARERLTRAKELFASAGDTDAAATVEQILEGLQEAASAGTG
jgi:tetratricopeptide (TPR) repeat protein